MNLVGVLEQAADEVDGVERAAAGGRAGWSVHGRPFASADAASAEFRLKPMVARAALGTPDTAVSAADPEWVAFRPPVIDRFAIDRARAWFASAAAFVAGEAASGSAGTRSRSPTPRPQP